ncbi:MAG TPA: class I SAM-dependent methyltransferase [Guyparkeria sp.]|nr:class I SAM-dependent methyltransferase [Guyparkeria sp.]
MSEFWNEKYGQADFLYGTRPNEFLLSQAYRLTPGARVLVLGDGEGRNGVWLAEQGFDVTTVDASAAGCAKARQLATERGVSPTIHCADLNELAWEGDGFDAVVLIFLHFEPASRREIYRRAAAALHPGGLLVIELFHPRQLAYQSGGPKRADMLVRASDLSQDLANIEWLLLAEGKVLLDEGPGHQGAGFVTHGVGRRTV